MNLLHVLLGSSWYFQRNSVNFRQTVYFCNFSLASFSLTFQFLFWYKSGIAEKGLIKCFMTLLDPHYAVTLSSSQSASTILVYKGGLTSFRVWNFKKRSKIWVAKSRAPCYVRGVLCLRGFLRLWKNNHVSRKLCKQMEWSITKWTNESTKINRVI